MRQRQTTSSQCPCKAFTEDRWAIPGKLRVTVIAGMKARTFLLHGALPYSQPLYAHLDSYAPTISWGDEVTAETVLGYVGTTGNAAGTPPHLHFGVYATGGALNPLPLLSDRADDKNATNKTEPASNRKRQSRLQMAL